jgi:hypothetical protein
MYHVLYLSYQYGIETPEISVICKPPVHYVRNQSLGIKIAKVSPHSWGGYNWVIFRIIRQEAKIGLNQSNCALDTICSK